MSQNLVDLSINVISLSEVWQWSGRQHLRIVGKNYGPILRTAFVDQSSWNFQRLSGCVWHVPVRRYSP